LSYSGVLKTCEFITISGSVFHVHSPCSQYAHEEAKIFKIIKCLVFLIILQKIVGVLKISCSVAVVGMIQIMLIMIKLRK
jgi:hypothetical protein